jgi:hypothetical protein
MKAITDPRGGGKTTKMIFEMLNNKDALMVVHSHMEWQRIISRHGELKGRVFTFDDFPVRSQGLGPPNRPVYVDNADLFLRRHFGNVTLISYSVEVPQEAPPPAAAAGSDDNAANSDDTGGAGGGEG